jgi:hypothetical protein
MWTLLLGLAWPAVCQAQAGSPGSSPTLLSARPPQHIVVDTSTSAPAVARGGSLTLYVDVAPKAAVHVYAEGAPGVTPVSLAVRPLAGVRLLPVKYPAAEKVRTLGALAPVNAYAKPFRIAQQVVLSPDVAPGESMVLAGVLTYQACDDRVCYPTAAAPVRWSVVVR